MTRQFDYGAFGESLWDGGILLQLTRIHEYKGRQTLYLTQKPAVLERLMQVAKVQSTESSNKIEGIVTTDTRIRELLNEKSAPRNRDEAEIAGYRDVLSLIHESYEHIPLRASVILQLHRNLYRYSGRDIGGRFKNSQNYINVSTPDGKSYTRFTPLEPWETPEAVETICREYRRAVDSADVDALLLIPVFIADFLCIHPFNDGNGRMSRLLTVLLLYQSGYLAGRYVSLERVIERSKQTYYDALNETSQNWHTGQNDYKPFIRYLLGVILTAYRTCEERLNILQPTPRPSAPPDTSRVTETSRKTFAQRFSLSTLFLSKAERRILSVMKRYPGGLSKAQIRNECPELGDSDLIRALRKLRRHGLLSRDGKGKRARYFRA